MSFGNFCDNQVGRSEQMSERTGSLVSSPVGSVDLLIEKVAALRVPAQVAQPVVPEVSVFVAPDQSCWSGSDEGFQDEGVHRPGLLSGSCVGVDDYHGALRVRGGREQLPLAVDDSLASVSVFLDHDAVQGPDTALIGDFVVPFSPLDRTPFFRLVHVAQATGEGR